MDGEDRSQIQDFYAGKKVFVTGATGFLGKILVEKLLRSTDVCAVYILVRSKKGKDVMTRMDELFDDPIFGRLKKEAPKFQHKIVGIAGDCCLAGLGMSSNDRIILQENVNIVFHAAATVRFDEQLKLAFTINVSATREIFNLCRKMSRLQALVHVSTAYSNCHVPDIDEKFYKYPLEYEEIEQILTKFDAGQIEKATSRLLGKWPNTYTFTKALAESFIRKNGCGLPVGIFRPSIVVSTYKEPIAGWIDNLYGPTGVCSGCMSGLMRILHCGKDITANIVPVDTCVSALIATAWDVGNQKSERITENIRIYNYVSCEDNPITWEEFMELSKIQVCKYPYSKSFWAPSFELFENPKAFLAAKLVYHYVPAALCDLLLIVSGQKPRMLTMYGKIDKFSEVISYFCTKNWKYEAANTAKLWQKLNRKDRELFPMDITTVSWLTYFRTYMKGIRVYLLKDPLDNLEVALRRHKRYSNLHGFLKFMIGFVTTNALWNLLYPYVVPGGNWLYKGLKL